MSEMTSRKWSRGLLWLMIGVALLDSTVNGYSDSSTYFAAVACFWAIVGQERTP